MNKEKTNYLLQNFPELFWQHELPMTQTCMCWLFEFGDGWFSLVKEMSEKLSPLVKEYNASLEEEGYRFGFVQMKEKFGGGRFYCGAATEEIHDIINEYELKCSEVCEVCGEPGELRNDCGWLVTSCDKCFENRFREMQK